MKHVLPALTGMALGFACVAEDFVGSRWVAPAPGIYGNEPLPLFRKEFALDRKPVRASLRIVGLGDYDPRVNGLRLSPTGINQPWSEYEKTLYYRDFEISNLVKGKNCVAVMMGNSFWHNPNSPAGRYNKDGPQRSAAEPFLLRAELRVEFSRGQPLIIGSDDSWTTAPGPVLLSHIYGGEDYDMRREQAGWDTAGGVAIDWKPVRVVEAPGGELRPMHFPPVTPYKVEKPSKIEPAKGGVWIYTFPNNTAAQLRVGLEGGKPGDDVKFRFGEHMKEGRLMGGYVMESHLVTTGGKVSHPWIFFYGGMQFVEVTGAVPKGEPNPQGLPTIVGLELAGVRAALTQVGAFQSSSAIYNGTHAIIDQAIRANMNWVMTDCPHREKLGWLECSYLLAPSFMYRYDGREWFAKIAADIRDTQEPSGRVRTVAPGYPKFGGGFEWTVEWGAAAVFVPWTHYEWYGDPEILRANYGMMRKFTDYAGTEAKDGIVGAGGLGDWYDYGHGRGPGASQYTPVELSATATWALCALRVSQAAEVLGKTPDAEAYRALHRRIASDFQRHFQDPATRSLRHRGSPQCANAMALCARLVPDADRPQLLREIIEDMEKRHWQQTAGDIGHVYVIRALAEAGRSDILHRVYSRDGVGSYGGILAKGLTSMPETWDAMMDGYQSLNHCMLGHVVEWFYGYVGGIRQAPGSVGWSKVLVQPNPGELSHAETEFVSPKGRIASHWEKRDGEFRLQVEVPKGVTASAVLPSGAIKTLIAGKYTLSEPLSQAKISSPN